MVGRERKRTASVTALTPRGSRSGGVILVPNVEPRPILHVVKGAHLAGIAAGVIAAGDPVAGLDGELLMRRVGAQAERGAITAGTTGEVVEWLGIVSSDRVIMPRRLGDLASNIGCRQVLVVIILGARFVLFSDQRLDIILTYLHVYLGVG